MTPSSCSPVPSGDKPPTTAGSTINCESEKNSSPSFSKPPQLVTIIVSKAPTEQKFVVHKELICFHSPFFKAAFNGKFIEGQTQEMRMDEVDEEAFGQLVHWLYTQELEPIDFKDVLVLVKLWVLAERALIPKLQNATIDALYPILRSKHPLFPSIFTTMQPLLDIVFGEDREEHSILRSLLVNHFASLQAHCLDSWAGRLPQKLLVQLTKAQAKDREVSRRKHRSVLATTDKATNYYVEIHTEKKDDAAKPQRKTDDKHAIPSRKQSSKLNWSLQEPAVDSDSDGDSFDRQRISSAPAPARTLPAPPRVLPFGTIRKTQCPPPFPRFKKRKGNGI